MSTRLTRYVLTALIVSGGANLPAQVNTESLATEADYGFRSDYFSFVGRDDQGYVAFAMDNNRTKSEARYTAEHALTFYDEATGWRSLEGDGGYATDNRDLSRIPDSDAFEFDGTVSAGLTIASRVNGLVLDIAPIDPVLIRGAGSTTYVWGAAPATLTWDDRRITGRVVHESIGRSGDDPPPRSLFPPFKNFNGMYLLVADAATYYFHHREGPLAEYAGREVGFADWAEPAEISNIEFSITDRRTGLGFYTWPTGWRGEFDYGGNRYRFEISVVDSETISNWILGAYSMAFAKGTISLLDGSRHWPVAGFAELIM